MVNGEICVMATAGGIAKRFLVYFIVGCVGALFYVIIFQKPPIPDNWDFILFGGIILLIAYSLEQLLFKDKE